jgi:hypothetical protein
MYVMMVVGRVDVPRSLRELTSFAVHPDEMLDIMQVFHDQCGKAGSENEEVLLANRMRRTMRSPDLIRLVDSILD